MFAGCSHDENTNSATVALPPAVVLHTPNAASWLPAGSTQIEGTGTGVTEIRVNGEAMVLEDGQFSGSSPLQRGINIIEAVGVEANGDTIFVRHGVIAGDFSDPGTNVTEAVAVRVNQGGLDQIATIAADQLDPQTINVTLKESNPVYETQSIAWTWIAANLVEIQYGDPTIALLPTPTGLAITVTLPDLFVDIDAYGKAVAFSFSEDISMSATQAVVTGMVVADAENGNLEVELHDASLSLDGFAYDLSILPDWVEDYLFVDAIKGAIEDTLIEDMNEKIPELIDENLEALDFSFVTEILNTDLSVDISFGSIEVDSQGLQVILSLDAHVPGEGLHGYNGYLSAHPGLPMIDDIAEMAMVVSDDLLNRLLFEVWRGGLMEMTLSTEDGSLDPEMLDMLQADTGSVTVSAHLPPVIVQQGNTLVVQVAELMVDLHTPGSELGENLYVAAAANVVIEMGVEGNVLSLETGEVDLSIMVRDSDWGATSEAITNLIEALLPVDEMLGSLDALTFELPELYGLSFDSAQLSRDSSQMHTAVAVELLVH